MPRYHAKKRSLEWWGHGNLFAPAPLLTQQEEEDDANEVKRILLTCDQESAVDEEHDIDKNWGKGTAGAQHWRHTQTLIPLLAAAQQRLARS